MERRDFLKKTALVMAAATIAPSMISANETQGFSLAQDPQSVGSDFSIVSDTVKDGVRYVVAIPSAKVCSKQIDIQINVKDNTIRSCAFTRGCPGNALGLCNLIKGMKVPEVITRLQGIPCASRGTSCPDQLSKVLKSL